MNGSTSAALGKCNVTLFWVKSHHRKRRHPYLQHDNEQLPKKCHEERYRCSILLKPHRPAVKIKEETSATEQGVQAPPKHIHKNKKKSRFGVRVKGSRNLGLTEDDEQSFVFWNGMCGKATGGARRSLSWLVTWS